MNKLTMEQLHERHVRGELAVATGGDFVVTDGMVIPGAVASLLPGQKMVAAGGKPVTALGGVYIAASSPGASIDPLISLKAPSGFTAPGVVQICASNVKAGCKTDAAGLPIQGFQVLQWPATAPKPTGVVLDGIQARNITPDAGDPNGVYNHGIYNQSGVGLTVKNALFENISGGWAIQFYPDSQDSRADAITARNCRGAIVFWGAKVTGNQVTNLACENIGVHGNVTYGDGASTVTNTVSYGTGWIDPVDVPGAILELQIACDNFVKQLHYTEAQVRKTHVYAALLKLGGSWR